MAERITSPEAKRAATAYMELSALLGGARSMLEADDGGYGVVENPVSDACEILRLAQARCAELGKLVDDIAVDSRAA
jgi:hypothetical protein